MSNISVKKAVEVVGGQAELAALCGVSQQAVYRWTVAGCPATRVLDVEKATAGKVTRHELRPDLYPLDEIPLLGGDRRRQPDPDHF